LNYIFIFLRIAGAFGANAPVAGVKVSNLTLFEETMLAVQELSIGTVQQQQQQRLFYTKLHQCSPNREFY
jgi:hypothetical protein